MTQCSSAKCIGAPCATGIKIYKLFYGVVWKNWCSCYNQRSRSNTSMQYTFIPFLNSMKSCPTNHISFSDNEVKHFYFNYYSKNLRYINLVQLFPNIISCDVCFFLQLLLLLFIVIIITIINFYCLLFIISFEYSRHSYGSALGCCIPLLDALIPIISFLVCNRCCCCGFLSLVERLIEYALLQRYYYYLHMFLLLFWIFWRFNSVSFALWRRGRWDDVDFAFFPTCEDQFTQFVIVRAQKKSSIWCISFFLAVRAPPSC